MDNADIRFAAAEQAALRRVAALVARGADPSAIFDAICKETGQLIEADSVNLAQLTPEGFSLTVAGWSTGGTHLPAGTRLALEEGTAGTPIVVEGDLWGALIVGADRDRPLPEGSEARIAGFAELVAMAVANVQARSQIAQWRHKEQALRERDAASYARQRTTLEAALDCVISVDARAHVTFFNAAAERTFGYEAAQVLGRDLADAIIPPALREQHRRGFARYLATEEAIVLDRRIEMTAMRADGSEFPVELTVTRVNLPSEISFTGYIRDITERRQAREALLAARRRVIESADAARRRVTRDLHDGAQQQLVNAVINLQLARQMWESEPGRARGLLDVAHHEAERGIDALRELAAGIHPAILADRGLADALRSLAAALPFPVKLDVQRVRLLPAIEASVYFFCSEALTNVTKHARANAAQVRVVVADDQLQIEVSDDGVGGATQRPGGSGLLGLSDRIGALDGSLEITSERERGTTLRAEIPLTADAIVSG